MRNKLIVLSALYLGLSTLAANAQYYDPRRYAPEGGQWAQRPIRPFEQGPRQQPFAPQYGGSGSYQGYRWDQPYRPYYAPRGLGGGRYFGGYPEGGWAR